MTDKQRIDIHKPEFMVSVIFKPIEPGLKLRPEETQLLLAYLGEILQEIETEEKLIVEEENAVKNKENTPCK